VSKKAWIIFAVVTVGILALLVITSRNSNPQVDVSNVDTNAIQAASAASGNIADHVFGLASSKVLLIEYGDFQCPGCGNAHPRIKAIADTYKDKVAFVFRNFPLTTIHPNARAAAGVVEAAGLQGKYWDMHNKVFESQSAWENLSGSERTDMFVSYAKELGLDTAKFTADLTSSSVSSKIAFDQALAKKLNVNSTPTFYLAGTQLTSDIWGDDAKLTAAIDAELKKVGVTPPSGVTE
jgi:protein-disulfide isomerase